MLYKKTRITDTHVKKTSKEWVAIHMTKCISVDVSTPKCISVDVPTPKCLQDT